jgi:hypothetical protein
MRSRGTSLHAGPACLFILDISLTGNEDKKMTKKYLGALIVALLAIASGTAAAQVERVTQITVSDPAGMIATIDQYVASGEGRAQSVTLLAHIHDGESDSTHTIVAIYENLEALESTMNEQASSAVWAATQRAAASVSKANSTALAIQRKTWGQDAWKEGDYLAAVMVNAADATRWYESMDEMMRTSKVKNPGMVRIVRLRGGPASHAVLLVAPTYAGLINYMENTEASDEFAKMRGSSESSTVGMTIYRVAKVWNP